MTASAINPAASALPGLAAGGNGQAVGPLAGFEALLAALFGNTDIAGVADESAAGAPAAATQAAPAPMTAQPTLAPLFVGFEAATGMPEAEPESVPAGEEVMETLAVPDALMAMAAAPTAPAPAPVETTAAAPQAGQPAAPSAVGSETFGGTPKDVAAAEPRGEVEPITTETQPTAKEAGLPSAAPQVATRTPPASAQATPTPTPPTAPASAPPTSAALTGETAEVAAQAPEPDPISLPLPPEALAQASAREEITRAADAPPPVPPSKKDKEKKGAVAERGADLYESRAEAPTLKSAPAAAGGASGGSAPGEVTVAKAPKIEGAEPEARKADLPEAFEQLQAPESRASSHGPQTAGAAPHGVRGAPETVASLAAEILKKLDGRSTRFDVELNPGDLGKVDVRVEIGANGRMTAALSFENPQAAAELKARSAELHKALEQAGFDLSGGGLSFDVAGDRGQPRQDWGDGQQGHFRGRAFQQAMDTASQADLGAVSGELRLRRGVTAGVDVRI